MEASVKTVTAAAVFAADWWTKLIPAAAQEVFRKHLEKRIAEELDKAPVAAVSDRVVAEGAFSS